MVYMRLLIRYMNGYRQDAILLVTMENRIRIAAPGSDDAMEFRFVGGHWISEDLEPVEIEESPEIEEYGWAGASQFDRALAALSMDCSYSLLPHPRTAGAGRQLGVRLRYFASTISSLRLLSVSRR